MKGRKFTSARSTNFKPTAAPPHFHNESSKLSTLTTNVSPSNTVFCPTVLLLSCSDHDPLCLFLELVIFKLYDCSVPNPQRKPEGPTPNRRRSSRSPTEGKPSRRAFNIEFCCLLVMAAAKDGALNQSAENGLRVGEAA